MNIKELEEKVVEEYYVNQNMQAGDEALLQLTQQNEKRIREEERARIKNLVETEIKCKLIQGHGVIDGTWTDTRQLLKALSQPNNNTQKE